MWKKSGAEGGTRWVCQRNSTGASTHTLGGMGGGWVRGLCMGASWEFLLSKSERRVTSLG